VKDKKMLIKKIVVGGMQSNCYIAGDQDTKEVFIIDPGGDHKRIVSAIEKNGLKAKAVINTHGHIDHISANNHLGLPVWIHEADADFLSDAGRNLSSLMGFNLKSPAAAKLLKDGDLLKAGEVSFEVIHTPGHTPGSICLRSGRVIFSGDTLFYSGVGRTDFPYGSEEALRSSIINRLFRLEDDIVVYPGHGPSTTIGREKGGDPFI
jgi:glyoxylase-like metal-dependent hydrolase (beta-lactamase superfamily II)